jgi:hypothetical protein
MPTVAMRAVRSRRKFVKAPTVQPKIGAVLDNVVKPHFIDEFDGVVSDWSGKPQFKARKFIRVDKIWITVFPAGPNKDKWIWVSRGTKGPYPIPKAGPSFLSFVLGYSARTKPRGQAHVGSGTATGPAVAGIMQVQHPGIEAREFEEVIKEDNEEWYSRTMENAWRRIIRSL